MLRIRVQRVVQRKFEPEPFLVGKTEGREAFGDGTESETLRCNVFLAFYVGCTNDLTEAMQRAGSVK
jgi:hypothetical protein